MVQRLFCGVLVLVMMASVVATAADPVGIEVRMRNAIGTLGVIDTKATVKTEADGTMLVSFHAPKEGTYYLVYTAGPKKGKNATSINVAKPGPITTKIKQ